jgi:hypothetical protein
VITEALQQAARRPTGTGRQAGEVGRLVFSDRDVGQPICFGWLGRTLGHESVAALLGKVAA